MAGGISRGTPLHTPPHGTLLFMAIFIVALVIFIWFVFKKPYK